ncbi:Protein IQ-DOMAIN 14 [Senna tora]|uniref:Protein IQ-DOMAIN 14 n=1 Tax=Senna tora TaxID=362788 RepID=A0A834WKW0_9FABA|nr:Protein IQ-DOMAIN 14 [Senna tora]
MHEGIGIHILSIALFSVKCIAFARKALWALKGIVKLQAIIRGIAVRRQAMTTLKCLQSIVNIQSQMDSNRERRWDDSILLKEEVDTSYISKKEALLRRERIKQYSFNHRMSAETERTKVNGRWRYWLEQWVDTQLSKSKELEDLDSTFSSHSRFVEEEEGNVGRSQLNNKLIRNIQIQRKQNQQDMEFGHSFPSSPSYMAATESAKAKAKAIGRSSSSPRVRIWNLDSNINAYDSDHSYYSPCKKMISLVSSSVINSGSEVLTSGGRMGKMMSSGNYQQISPSLKGLSPRRKLG